jgi:gp16 family phage-associated protein
MLNMQIEASSFNFEQISRVRQEFHQAGRSVSDWAKSQGFDPALVYSVLAGRNRATRGKSHKIAVRLGLKAPLQTAMVSGLLPTAQSQLPAVVEAR